MKYKYKFWSRFLRPFNWVLMKFGYHIVFRYNNVDKIFEKFDSMRIVHRSNL